jgi:hypothetical protein
MRATEMKKHDEKRYFVRDRSLITVVGNTRAAVATRIAAA